MNFAPRILALAVMLASTGAPAQTLDLGPDISPLKRFQVYPHIDKAFEAMARGDGTRAIAELEHAHRLAPENTAIALHLAQAYQRFGQPARAAALLRAQRSRHPGDARIAQALRDLQPPPAPVQESATVVAQPEAAPAAPVLAAAPSATAPEPASEHGTPAAAPAIAAPPDQLAKPAPAVRAQRRMAQVPRPRRADGAPGYAAASRAYEAVERAELPAALAWAREAAQAAPANADYQRLLTYLLIENGLYEEAQAKAQEAELTFAPQGDTQWQALGDTARQRHAYAQFEAASQAQRQGRASDALAHAQAAAEQAPGVPAYRLQWVGLLLAAGRYAQAQQVAEQGLTQGDGAALQVLRGAALQAQGQTDDAARVFDGVIGRPDLAPHEQQNYRVIAADAALAARQPERAKALLQPLAQGGAVDVSGREAEIRAATRRPISAASLQTFSLRLPVVNCFGSAQAPGCEVWPGQDAPDPARAVAQEAFRVYTERDYGLAAAKAEEAARLQPAHLPYRLLRLQALVAAGQVEQALREADDTLQSRADGAEVLALRSRVYHDLGRREQASADARAALQAGGLSLSSEINLLLQEGRRDEAVQQFAHAMAGPDFAGSADPDLAYLAARVGDDRTALAVFDRAHANDALPAAALPDGAYTASRLAENDRAIYYLQQTIDAVEAGRLEQTPRQQFATRRELADRTRTWGINALLGYRGMSPGSISPVPGLYRDAAQLVGEAYWRPQGYRDGSFWEIYGGVVQTVYSRHGGTSGSDTTQGALGVRAKPLRDHNLVLSAERRIRIGSLSFSDWLLRAGYSYGVGTDLRVDVPDWFTFNVYAEAGRFLQRKQDYVTFEAQAGRSFRMGDADSRLVLFPHAVVGVDYNSARTAAGYNGAAGAGVGIALRRWFREDRYNAPRSYLDLSLQYRARLAGDERGKGVFLRAALVF